MRLLMIALAAALLAGCAALGSSPDDSRNEALAAKRIAAAHPQLADAHINVNSFNGVLLITGQVASAELIAMATTQAESLRNVHRVHNELAVAGVTTRLSRTNDALLTGKVRAALGAAEAVDTARVKVVTENAVVYLMGRLTRAEADEVVAVTREARGIQKIVTLFEYSD